MSIISKLTSLFQKKELSLEQTRRIVYLEVSRYLVTGRKILFVHGPAGCGKTSLASQLKSQFQSSLHLDLKLGDIEKLSSIAHELTPDREEQAQNLRESIVRVSASNRGELPEQKKVVFVDGFDSIFDIEKEKHREVVSEISQTQTALTAAKVQVVLLSQRNPLDLLTCISRKQQKDFSFWKELLKETPEKEYIFKVVPFSTNRQAYQPYLVKMVEKYILPYETSSAKSTRGNL